MNQATRARSRRWGARGLTALAAVALAGCTTTSGPAGNTGSPASSPTSTTSAGATSTGAAPTGGTPTSGTSSPCPTGFATSAPGDTSLSRATVSGVRVGQQPCADRLVVEMTGDTSIKPGYQVRYVPAVLQEGSGKAVPLRGSAYLLVSVGAASYDGAGQPTYLPANRAEVADVTGFPVFKQVAWAGSFEGMTTFGIGVSGQLPFKVQVLTEQGTVRVVVDVARLA